jgi:hypothetical protein
LFTAGDLGIVLRYYYGASLSFLVNYLWLFRVLNLLFGRFYSQLLILSNYRLEFLDMFF